MDSPKNSTQLLRSFQSRGKKATTTIDRTKILLKAQEEKKRKKKRKHFLTSITTPASFFLAALFRIAWLAGLLGAPIRATTLPSETKPIQQVKQEETKQETDHINKQLSPSHLLGFDGAPEVTSSAADVLTLAEQKRLFGASSSSMQVLAEVSQHESQTANNNFQESFSEVKSHLLLLFALLVLINLIVILGNILVILAVYATAKLRNVTNIFIVSLATADLMLGVFVLPYALTFEVSFSQHSSLLISAH